MKYIHLFKPFLNEQELAPRSVVVKTGEDKKENSKFSTESIGRNFPNRIPAGGRLEDLYKSDTVKKSIEDLKPKILKFIADNKNSSQFTLSISAGESQMTNPEEFKTPGGLALARANVVRDYVNEIFSDLISSKKLIISSPSSVSEVKIGKTPYKGLTQDQRNSNADLYKSEQFVNIDLSGTGSKIIKGKDETKTYCGKSINSQGFALLPQDGYVYKQKVDLGPGAGKITIELNAIDVPDILYIEYNGKTYGNSVLRGNRAGFFTVAVGTAMLYAFKNNEGIVPAWGDQNKFQELDANNSSDYPRIIEGIKNIAEYGLARTGGIEGPETQTNWGCFYNIFGNPKSSEKNDAIISKMLEFDKKYSKNSLKAERYAKSLVNDLKDLGMKWGVLSTDVINKGIYTVDIDKVDGVNELMVIDCAPCGATKWEGKIICK